MERREENDKIKNDFDEINKNKDLQDKLKVNMSLHEKNNFAKFDDRQTEKLLNYINGKVKQGKSIRSACLELSKNNATLMIRYQNKYHALKNKIAKVSSLENAKQNNKNDLQSNNSNILSFPTQNKLKPQKLTDDEIKSLLSSLDSSVEEKNSHKEMNTIYSEQDIFNKFNDINSTYGVVFVNNVIEFIKKHHNFKLACDVLECFNSKRKVQEIRECEMHFLYKMQEIIKNSIKPQRFLVVLYKSGNPEWKNFTNDLFDKYVKLAKQAGFNIKEDL